MLNANSFVPWQVLLRLLQLPLKTSRADDDRSPQRTGCEHLTAERRQRFLDGFSASLRQRHHAIPDKCQNCLDRKAKYVCIDCFGYFCDRSSGRGCMASHRHSDSTKADVNMGVTCEYGGIYCYACNSEYSGTTRGLSAAEIISLQMASSRDPRVAAHHFGLFQRNQCPHVDDITITLLAKAWRTFESRYCNARCCDFICATAAFHSSGSSAAVASSQPKLGKPDEKCTSMRVWLCLTCFQLFCNDEPAQHFTTHARTEKHFVAVSIRTLNIFCCSCDRYLGFGGSAEDYAVALAIRRIMRTSRLIQHKEFPDPPATDEPPAAVGCYH